MGSSDIARYKQDIMVKEISEAVSSLQVQRKFVMKI